MVHKIVACQVISSGSISYACHRESNLVIIISVSWLRIYVAAAQRSPQGGADQRSVDTDPPNTHTYIHMHTCIHTSIYTGTWMHPDTQTCMHAHT